MSDFKPMLLNAILELELKDIEATFPNGVIRHEGKGKAQPRFSPTPDGEEPFLSQRALSKEKRRRQAPKRLLGKTHGYTENPAFALYTTPDCGEAVDEITQRQYSENGWQGFLGGLESADSTHPHLYIQRRIQKKGL